MSFESVDKLQQTLTRDVFHYAKDSKKAAGRALGTLVEVITYYVLKSWRFGHFVSIERGLKEYGNVNISHNVEYSLHPVLQSFRLDLPNYGLPLTSAKILTALRAAHQSSFEVKSRTLLSKELILRNACVVASSGSSSLLAFIDQYAERNLTLTVVEQHAKPLAMFECKRVGVEEGNRKGPQTIEKAKQGAYVARTVSSLQKVRTRSGELHGIMPKDDNTFYTKPYVEMLAEIIASDDASLLRDFILTVGVVSNHGNWFTSDNPNKELLVLAQSYDWLLFLSDDGLAEFIHDVLLSPSSQLKPARDAFLASYSSDKRKNQFTKVKMNLRADLALQDYFRRKHKRIAKWFNVISPKRTSLHDLQGNLAKLSQKDWTRLLE